MTRKYMALCYVTITCVALQQKNIKLNEACRNKAYLENTYSVSLYTFASVVLVKTDVCVHKLVKRYSKAVMCSTHGVN